MPIHKHQKPARKYNPKDFEQNHSQKWIKRLITVALNRSIVSSTRHASSGIRSTSAKKQICGIKADSAEMFGIGVEPYDNGWNGIHNFLFC